MTTVLVDVSSGVRRRSNEITDQELVLEVCDTWQWKPDDVITIYTDGSKNPEAESISSLDI